MALERFFWLRLRPRLLDLTADFDLDFDRIDFLDFEREGIFLFLVTGFEVLQMASLNPFVCLKMFLFTLFIFFRERLLPLPLTADDIETADLDDDLADLVDLSFLTDFDLDLLLDLLLLTIFFRLKSVAFFLEIDLLLDFDLLRELYLDRLLMLLEGDAPKRCLRALLLRLNFFFDPDREIGLDTFCETGWLLLADLTSYISLIISFIRMFLRLLSVASTISDAMFSILLENPSTRLLNYETPIGLLSSVALDC